MTSDVPTRLARHPIGPQFVGAGGAGVFVVVENFLSRLQGLDIAEAAAPKEGPATG